MKSDGNAVSRVPTSGCASPTGAGLRLKGRGGIGAVPEQLRSGRRGCESGLGGGGFWRLEMRLGAGVGL